MGMIVARTLLACLALSVLPGVVSAQSSLYGTLTCDAGTAQANKNQANNNGAEPNGGADTKGGAGAKKAGLKNGDGSKKGASSKKTRVQNDTPANTDTGSASKVATSNGSGLTSAVSHEKCSWSLPLLIGDEMALEAENTINSDVAGEQSKDTGTHTSRMSNSDQFTMSLSGNSVLDSSGAPRTRAGTWTLGGGTGQLKGITGSGTYSAVARAAGGMSYDIEGTYQLPASPAASPTPTAPSAPTAPSSAASPVPVTPS
jgi:hypothetical protein